MTTMRHVLRLGLLVAALVTTEAGADPADAAITAAGHITLGPRPLFLAQDMSTATARERELKTSLLHCAAQTQNWRRTPFSIAHRGAPLQFPEHTREAYIAAAQMGAGILECDVTFTADNALVCRHAQCDLHTTTNIVSTDLAQRCSVPPVFDPDSGDLTNAASIRCCASDITLAEFRRLQGRMEGVNKDARRIEDYLDGTPSWRTDLYATRGTLMTHAESIELFKALGVKMTPELKTPEVAMPFNGMSREDYAQRMIDEYKAAGVPPGDVFAQSFDLNDVLYWIEHEPAFARQAVYLDGRYRDRGFDPTAPATWSPSMEDLAAQGVKILAPPMWMLLGADPAADDGGSRIVPSPYATHARAAGLALIAWTLERSGPLAADDLWYHRTTAAVMERDGDEMHALDVLARDVGVIGVFSDWPATVTFYDNCMRPGH